MCIVVVGQNLGSYKTQLELLDKKDPWLSISQSAVS